MSKRKAASADIVEPPATPLRNRSLLESASASYAAELIRAPGKQMTAMRFCLDVLHGKLGLKEYAIGQWERTIISSARKSAMGTHDMRHIVKPPPAAAADVPSIVEAIAGLCEAFGGSSAPPSPARSWTERVEAILDDSEATRQIELGGGIVRPLLTQPEVVAVARELAGSAPSSGVTFLRESSGSGSGGAYSGVRLSGATPIISALNKALADALQTRTGCGKLGGKVLATRYGEHGVNWAHQDQSAHPYQAYLLLSRPGVDFRGGALYMTDPAAVAAGDTGAEHDLAWSSAGEIAIFCANWRAPGGRQWYHGIREVRAGTATPCSMVAVGLLE